MELLFNLDYLAGSGDKLMLNIIREDVENEVFEMQTADGRMWSCRLSSATHPGQAVLAGCNCIDYFYTVVQEGKTLRHEWLVQPHRLELVYSKGTSYVIYDHWIDIPEDSYMYSSAFTECVNKRCPKPSTASDFTKTVRLKVRAPQLRQGERLAIVGGQPYLGNWNPHEALPMTEHQYNEWVISLDASKLPSTFEFKFITQSSGETDGSVKPNSSVWENGINRTLTMPAFKEGDVVVYELPQAYFPVYPWRGAGTVIPVFALRSEGSFGVGDFGDLKLMIEWCYKTHQRILQVLPINDTNFTHTWEDSYPYNSISIYALHPQYIDLRQLPPIEDEVLRNKFESLRYELNALSYIDYERVFQAKLDYLAIVYGQHGARVLRTKAYKEFFERNKAWLVPYADFCAANNGNSDISQTTKRPIFQTTNFWYYLQYQLDLQMRAAHAYARQHSVILKGDIPIGISRDGVDAKVEPKYFNMNGQAGAPPDAFTEDGQNWGFPTYNWDEMLKDNCQWWVRRFRKMQDYFDAYRIDHVLGFFRIWEIPMPHKSGLYGQFQPALPFSREEIAERGLPFREELYLEDHKRKDLWHPRINALKTDQFLCLDSEEQHRFHELFNDYFYRRNNQFWYQEAMKKLPLLTQATRMLVCAEDLGMVPDCVSWVMRDLRILSLEIQSMPKEPGIRFGKLSHNPYRSVCTISTHDMPTLRQWWDEDLERTQDYFNTMLHRSGSAPHPLPGWLAKDIVSRHLTSPSMLCLLSFQDWIAMDEELRLPDANAERINIPANPRHYWRYRMHITLEQLLAADYLNENIRQLISDSGRK